jgi:hypothetical protein
VTPHFVEGHRKKQHRSYPAHKRGVAAQIRPGGKQANRTSSIHPSPKRTTTPLHLLAELTPHFRPSVCRRRRSPDCIKSAIQPTEKRYDVAVLQYAASIEILNSLLILWPRVWNYWELDYFGIIILAIRSHHLWEIHIDFQLLISSTAGRARTKQSDRNTVSSKLIYLPYKPSSLLLMSAIFFRTWTAYLYLCKFRLSKLILV